jgi:hypothetical protein
MNSQHAPLSNTISSEEGSLYGLYFNRDDRSEYIEFNRDGSFLQYDRCAQLAGRYTLTRGVLRMTLSDGRTAQMLMQSGSLLDDRGKTWAKKEKTAAPPPQFQDKPASKPAARPWMTWLLLKPVGSKNPPHIIIPQNPPRGKRAPFRKWE